MCITRTPQNAFDVMIIDTIGPLPTSNVGYKYAVTMICDLTKYLITAPIVNKTAKEVAKAIFENLVLVYGPVREIRTDKGTEYNNEIMTELCKLLKIEHKTSTSYHHESVGSIERNHRTLNEYIRSYIKDMSNWNEYLSYFTFCYNTTQNSVFNHDYSPYELVFGRKINLIENLVNQEIEPVYNVDDYAREIKYRLQSVHEKARNLLDKLKHKNKAYYDRRNNSINIQINDEILIKKEPYDKFKQVYDGPFKVTKIDEFNITVQVNNKNITVHKNRVIKHNK